MGPSASKYAGIGLQFAVSILLFLYAGQWLDRRLGTSPVFLMLGVFVGAGAAFYSMYRGLMAEQRAERQAADRREVRQASGTARHVSTSEISTSGVPASEVPKRGVEIPSANDPFPQQTGGNHNVDDEERRP